MTDPQPQQPKQSAQDDRRDAGHDHELFVPPVVLSIAGSDSSGGAGIQADLRTYAALGVHGATAIAALTAQNTTEVRAVVTTDPGFLVAQIEAVLDDLAVGAVKTGMLASAANVEAVAALAEAGRLPNLVVDPVMVASTGARLLDPEAEAAYLERLLPQATVTTPNCREAAALLGSPVDDLDQQVAAAKELHRRTGARWVVVKGGDRMQGSEAVDIVCDGALTEELIRPRIPTTNNHGTGCSFASATAAFLARGEDPRHAVEHAKDFVHTALTRGARWRLGAGHGPIDHLGFADA